VHEECSRLLRNPVGHTLLQWGATGGGCAGVSCKAVDEVNPRRTPPRTASAFSLSGPLRRPQCVRSSSYTHHRSPTSPTR